MSFMFLMSKISIPPILLIVLILSKIEPTALRRSDERLRIPSATIPRNCRLQQRREPPFVGPGNLHAAEGRGLSRRATQPARGPDPSFGHVGGGRRLAQVVRGPSAVVRGRGGDGASGGECA